MNPPVNPKRYEKLIALPPIEAVRAWLEGDFGLGDEPAMISAIRKDSRITLSDADISEAMWEMHIAGRRSASRCLKQLTVPQ
jgi:hypothetical protein